MQQAPKEFLCPDTHLEALGVVENKILRGLSLRPHLSGQLRIPGYNDMLLNAWDIHHLHLGTEIQGGGFVKRTGPVLLARFTDDAAYLIAVMGHGNWEKQKLVKIIHNNWPESIERYRVQGVTGLSRNITDESVKVLRKGGVNSLIAPEPGAVYAPIGGGYMGTGLSIHVLRWCDDCYQRLRNLENYVRNTVDDFIAEAQKNNREVGERLLFHFRTDTDRAYILEETTKLCFQVL